MYTYHSSCSDQVCVVTAFLELHHDVNERAVTITLSSECFIVPGQDQLVVLPENKITI